MSALPSESSLQVPDPNPTTPAFDDGGDWIVAYLKIHALSHTTWRYAYFLWFGIGVVAFVFAVSHLLGLRSGTVGAYWSKWSFRRRTWRKKYALAKAKKSGQAHKQPFLFPSNAQLLTFSTIVIASLAATFLGPDYIAPSHQFKLFRRAAGPDVAEYIPQYTVHKAWWSSGNRAGLTAFALFPLCILFALKRPPFAIFAIPFFTHLHADKLIWLHRWIGRLIWALVVLHATFWSVQLFKDKRAGTEDIAYIYAWHYRKFMFAWTVSARSIRAYEYYLSAFTLGVHSVHAPHSAVIRACPREVLRQILCSPRHPCPWHSHNVSAPSPTSVVVVLAIPPAMVSRENLAGNQLAIS